MIFFVAVVLPVVVLVLVVAAMVAVTNVKMNTFRGSSTVRIPVDDFVVGDLPPICVRTGTEVSGLVGIESDEGAFRPWWLLLLFLGPVGVVAIVLLWTFAARPSRVGGLVPMTREALADQNRLVAIASWVWAVPVVAFIGGAGLLMIPRIAGLSVAVAGVGLLALGLFGGFVFLAVLAYLTRRETVRVRLDGTGRWVELRNVHPSFATTVDRQTRARHRAARERRERLDD